MSQSSSWTPNEPYQKITLGLIILFLFCPGVASGQKLVLNTGNEYPLSTPQGTGFEDRIFKEAFRRIGKELKIVHLPSERALVNADQGIDDGIFVRIAGLEKIYPNLVMVPEKISEFEFAAFTRDPAVRINNWESLKPYHVGIITGWKILEAHIVGTRSLTKVKDPEALFKLLMHDRVDLVVYDRLQGQALVKKWGLVEVRALKPLLARKDMFLYLNRRHAGLVPELAAALKEMKRDGSFKRLINSVLNEMD